MQQLVFRTHLPLSAQSASNRFTHTISNELRTLHRSKIFAHQKSKRLVS